jgi:hypothetical protein
LNTKKKLNILFLNGHTSDYLGIGLLHGLKSLPNTEVYDFPISEILYRDNKEKYIKQIRGGGFTLFFLHENKPLDRFHLTYDKLRSSFFDLIIFNDIKSNFGMFVELLPILSKAKTVILDGSDSPALYPYEGQFWRVKNYWFLPRAHSRFIYFKREWTSQTYYYRSFKMIPPSISKNIFPLKNVKPISFSIPEEKIIKNIPEKKKTFPKHIVDQEIALKVEGSSISNAFEKEEDYYNDLSESKFGITTKRSGWDCLRHYEIAANGTVICFKELDKKPETCAPHGLIPGQNCINYSDYDDLMRKIAALTDAEYEKLVDASLNWAKKNSTKNRAIELLKMFGLDRQVN